MTAVFWGGWPHQERCHPEAVHSEGSAVVFSSRPQEYATQIMLAVECFSPLGMGCAVRRRKALPPKKPGTGRPEHILATQDLARFDAVISSDCACSSRAILKRTGHPPYCDAAK